MAATLQRIIPLDIQIKITLDFLGGMNYNDLVKKYGVSKYYVVRSVTRTLRAAQGNLDLSQLAGWQWRKSSSVARKDKKVWREAIAQLVSVSVS